jgi:hypothetical protein
MISEHAMMRSLKLVALNHTLRTGDESNDFGAISCAPCSGANAKIKCILCCGCGQQFLSQGQLSSAATI